jgi:hypothetical protein
VDLDKSPAGKAFENSFADETEKRARNNFASLES